MVFFTSQLFCQGCTEKELLFTGLTLSLGIKHAFSQGTRLLKKCDAIHEHIIWNLRRLVICILFTRGSINERDHRCYFFIWRIHQHLTKKNVIFNRMKTLFKVFTINIIYTSHN